MGTLAPSLNSETYLCLELFERRRTKLFPKTTIARIAFAVHELTSVAGTVDNFYFTTRTESISLSPKGVTVACLPVQVDGSTKCETFQDRLSYVIEQVAGNNLGDAKYELSLLIEDIEQGQLELEYSEFALKKLTAAESNLRDYEVRRSAALLSQISRHYWRC